MTNCFPRQEPGIYSVPHEKLKDVSPSAYLALGIAYSVTIAANLLMSRGLTFFTTTAFLIAVISWVLFLSDMSRNTITHTRLKHFRVATVLMIMYAIMQGWIIHSLSVLTDPLRASDLQREPGIVSRRPSLIKRIPHFFPHFNPFKPQAVDLDPPTAYPKLDEIQQEAKITFGNIEKDNIEVIPMLLDQVTEASPTVSAPNEYQVGNLDVETPSTDAGAEPSTVPEIMNAFPTLPSHSTISLLTLPTPPPGMFGVSISPSADVPPTGGGRRMYPLGNEATADIRVTSRVEALLVAGYVLPWVTVGIYVYMVVTDLDVHCPVCSSPRDRSFLSVDEV